ncbi:glycosyltransferase family 2 protein [Paenibacillus polymyxa]|uniref:glycosyltransferase family 2 protein n=1 Tax=Paenibacillus polymyxa TaxID=1406 RepID=UPI00046E753A|nr:glycosyltransferase family 2 protein [Paenibacillus polymyxa]URJ59862.3 glycosyltransferase family 2 protein [Paenibacillus polymyxa]
MKTLLIIPAYNEKDNIGRVISEIRNDLDFADILIVNDCSTDDTLKILQGFKGIKYITLPVNLGYAGALQTGFKYAVNHNYDVVIQFDGDGQHIANEAKELYDFFINKKADIVIGSRFLSNSVEYKNSFFRGLGTLFFRKIIKGLCNVEVTDPTSGFQILSKEVFEKYSKINNYPEYPDANLLIQMILQGYKVEEKYVKMRNREFGESMHSGVLKPTKYMIKMFYAIALITMKKKYLIQKNY